MYCQLKLSSIYLHKKVYVLLIILYFSTCFREKLFKFYQSFYLDNSVFEYCKCDFKLIR